jgi:hypothetical protein
MALQWTVDRPVHHSAKKATTQPKKVVNFDHEMTEIGLTCSNFVEKTSTPAILGRTLQHDISELKCDI